MMCKEKKTSIVFHSVVFTERHYIVDKPWGKNRTIFLYVLEKHLFSTLCIAKFISINDCILQGINRVKFPLYFNYRKNLCFKIQWHKRIFKKSFIYYYYYFCALIYFFIQHWIINQDQFLWVEGNKRCNTYAMKYLNIWKIINYIYYISNIIYISEI